MEKFNSKDLKIFWDKVNKTNNCWNWIARTNGKGKYGRFSINGKDESAHRISWIIHFGQIPKGLYVCHKCDNPKCVNPKHLFLGTHLENMQDMQNKGRNIVFKGEKNGRSKLKKEQVLEIRKIGNNLSYNQIARKFNVNAKTISDIINNVNWKCV